MSTRFAPAALALAALAAGCALPAPPGTPGPAGPPAAEAAAPAVEGAPGTVAVPAAATPPGTAGFSLLFPRFQGHLTLDGQRGEPDGNPWGTGFGVWGEIRPEGWVAWFDFESRYWSDDLGFEAWHPWFGNGNVDHTFSFFEAAAGPVLVDVPPEPVETGPEGGVRPPPQEGARVVGPSRFRVDTLAGLRVNVYRFDADFQYDVSLDPEYRTWADPFVGARMECRPLPWLALLLRGDVGGFGVASDLAWRATGKVSVRVGPGAWISAGWDALRIDYERGDHDNFTVDSCTGGPAVSLDLWF